VRLKVWTSIALGLTLAVAAAAILVPSSREDRRRSVEGAPVSKTAARRIKPLLRFAVIGDFGTGGRRQAAVARKMCRWRRRHPFRLVLTTGDNIYPRGAPKDFDAKFLTPYACLLNNGVRFRAVLGNHDVATDKGRPELEEPAFGMKARNYVVRTHRVRLVFADSNAFRRGWLKRAARERAGDRWTIVLFHHPVYSPGTHHGSTPGLRSWLPRLLRWRGVDLVLNGHEHNFAVTKPLRGLRYVVSGGGGDALYDCGKKWFSATCRKRWHFLHVVVGRNSILVRAVSPAEGVFHRFRTRGVVPRR
jgi:hypothetical protein